TRATRGTPAWHSPRASKRRTWTGTATAACRRRKRCSPGMRSPCAPRRRAHASAMPSTGADRRAGSRSASIARPPSRSRQIESRLMAAGVTGPVLLLAFVLRPEMPQGAVAVAVAVVVAVAVALAVKDVAVPLMPADPEGAAQGYAV